MAKSAEISSNFISDVNLMGVGAAPGAMPNLVSKASHELLFGQYLRRERILRGISRKEIIAYTKVSDEYIDALENNQFDRLPPQAFVVGFLRILSRYAGLDGDAVVNRFLAEHAQREAYEEAEQKRMGYIKRHLKKILAIGGFACLLVLMLVPYFKHRI